MRLRFYRLSLRTYCYIDGFNLYGHICALVSENKATVPNMKWVDLEALVNQKLDPHHDVIRIKYFTAKHASFKDCKERRNLLKARLHRQGKYWLALSTRPKIERVDGNFKKVWKRGRFLKLVTHGKKNTPNCLVANEDWVEVEKYEEKESDVNIATHMIYDCCKEDIDCVVLVSNDTDLKPPLKFARYCLGKRVGILSPAKETQPHLKRLANFSKIITEKDIRDAQFDSPLYDANGDKIYNPWTSKVTPKPLS